MSVNLFLPLPSTRLDDMRGNYDPSSFISIRQRENSPFFLLSPDIHGLVFMA